MEQMLLVPVRTSAAGTLALRTGRLPSGERVGLAFTCESRLEQTLGQTAWVYLAGEALADMLAPLGIEHFRVDPGRAGQLHPATPPAAIHFCSGRGREAARPLARRVA